MNVVIKLIDLNYYCHEDLSNPATVLELHRASTGYVPYIRQQMKVELIKHMNFEGVRYLGAVKCSFFHSRTRYWHIPFKTHHYIREQQPDIVLVQGLIFPLQVIALKIELGKQVKIVIQHHGEHPANGLKKWLQKIADRFVTMYVFTSRQNAGDWIENKIILNPTKYFEILEASSWFKKNEKESSIKKLQLTSTLNFLWVGRLNANKDPMTVITAFERFILQEPHVRLYMMFQTTELLDEIQKRISSSPALSKAIILLGKVEHSELEEWFNAADFYISASHHEGSGYALLEAMACGCIPIVSSIPSFKKITSDGAFGFLFEAGNSESLLQSLLKAKEADVERLSLSITEYFHKSLSFQSIADGLYQLSQRLTSKESHD